MIRFDPLTQAEFESYSAQAVKGYAVGPTRGGRWKPKEALEEKSRDGSAKGEDGHSHATRHKLVKTNAPQ